MGLDADWSSAIAAGVSAIVAIVAAGFAFWQARVAAAAKEAAADQAATAREALELQRAERDERAAPQFRVTILPPAGDQCAQVQVHMVSGTFPVWVDIDHVNGWARRTAPDKISRKSTCGETRMSRRLVAGAVTSYHHTAPPDANAIWSTATIHAREDQGNRRWTVPLHAEWQDPDRPLRL